MICIGNINYFIFIYTQKQEKKNATNIFNPGYANKEI